MANLDFTLGVDRARVRKAVYRSRSLGSEGGEMTLRDRIRMGDLVQSGEGFGKVDSISVGDTGSITIRTYRLEDVSPEAKRDAISLPRSFTYGGTKIPIAVTIREHTNREEARYNEARERRERELNREREYNW